MGVLSISTRLLATPEGVAQWLQHGKEALVAKHGERAERAFGSILEAHPETPEALQGLLTAWLLQGKSDQVIEYHDSSSEHVQQQLREYLWIALAMQVGHLTQEGYARWICLPNDQNARMNGLQTLSEAFSKCGALSMDFANAALACYRLDIAQQALKQLRDAQPRLPEREVARLHARRDAILLQEHPEIGALLKEASNITSPIERFDRLEPIARRSMDVAALQREAGLALLEANRPEEAMRFLNRAVDINPYWLNAWIELGMAAKAAHRFVRAKEAFTRAFHLSREPWLQVMQAEIEEKLEFEPHLPPLETAKDRMQVGDFPGAILPLQKAMKASDDPQARWKLGEAYFARGNYARACSYLRGVWADSLEANETLSNEQLSLLELSTHQQCIRQMAQGDVEDALDLLDEMLSAGEYFDLLREDQWIARRLLQEEISTRAFVLYERARPHPGKPLEACLALINDAIEDSEHFPEALIARAVLQAELGDLDAAHRDLKFALGALEATGTGVFHLAGLAFLRQDLAMARALWKRSANEGHLPWSQRSMANLNALETQSTQDLFIAWLPTHQRVIEFAPQVSLSLDDLVAPTQEAVLFEVSPSQTLDAVAIRPTDEVKALEEAALPRFSDLVPDDAEEQASIDPLAFLSSDLLPSAAKESASETDMFGIEKDSDALPTFLVEDEKKEWDLGESKANDLLVPPDTNKADAPLFNIGDKEELEAEFPLDLVREQAVQTVPRLSDVLPEQAQGLEDFGQPASLFDDEPAAPIAETPAPNAPAPFAGFAEQPAATELPLTFQAPSNGTPVEPEQPIASLLGPDPVAAPQDEPEPPGGLDIDDLFGPSEPVATPTETKASNSSNDLTASLFGGDDDLSSFLDEAFLSLDNIEKK